MDFSFLVPFIFALIAGILVKIVDWLDDDKKSTHPIKFLFAIFYGALIGYLISTASFSTLFLAGLFAQVFARNIDTTAHKIGFLTSIIAMFVFGLPLTIDIVIFGYFLILAFMDELKLFGSLEIFSEYRLFLKLGTLPFIFFGRFDYLIAILCSDFGYVLSEFLAHRSFPVAKAKTGAKSKKTRNLNSRR
ncbi:hypothetical protein HZC07_05750 [Candidatus Micrarchaeota archaeon]|nr:hypothetical protein [Candidatus Micrarchaeota archaeon]